MRVFITPLHRSKILVHLTITCAFVLVCLSQNPLRAADCVDTSPATAQAAIQDARRAILTLEYEATLAKLEEVRRSLPCLTGTLPQETISQLYFFQGLLSLNTGKEADARQAFSDAASILPLLQEEREHSSQVRELWASARDDVTRSTGTLAIPNLPSDALAYVDGRPLQEGEQTTNVYPGVHLLQVMGDDRRLHGTLMRVRPGETSLVPEAFLASLTPRGELVLEVKPRRSHVVVRQGNAPTYDLKHAARRTNLADVREGAYIVEVSRPGFYPFSQGKVAVEGGDQTKLDVSLVRRPSVMLNVTSGVFWLSASPSDSDPVVSFELVGRTSEGWGLHLEYLHHIQDDGVAANGDRLESPSEYIQNPYYEGRDEDGNYIDGPPWIPNVTTVGLGIGGRIYAGVSRQFSIEALDIAPGAKIAIDLKRESVFFDVAASYNFLPWVGIEVRAGAGVMIHVSDYIWNIEEEYTTSDYFRIGGIGLATAGLKGGF